MRNVVTFSNLFFLLYVYNLGSRWNVGTVTLTLYFNIVLKICNTLSYFIVA